MKRFGFGFTLAEVLITLGIIGVVAALTIPTLMVNVSERSNSERQANIAQKITKSMELMRADGKLYKTYESTDAFVDELQNYLKISQRCDANHIADCWPTPTITRADGSTFEVSKAKKGIHLQLPDNTTDNVGLILADGSCIILSYNQDAAILNDSDTLAHSKKTLPIGFGRSKEYAYTSSVTNSIDFVMDVNGSGGPNSEQRDGKMFDVRSFKIAAFSDGLPGTEVPGLGRVYDLDFNYEPHSSINPNNGNTETNYFLGAKAACEQMEMSLATKSQLHKIYELAHTDGNPYSLPTSGDYWGNVCASSDCDTVSLLDNHDFQNHNWNRAKAMCISN